MKLLPTPGVPLPVTPISNPVSEAVNAIQLWSVLVASSLITLVLLVAILVGLKISEVRRGRR